MAKIVKPPFSFSYRVILSSVGFVRMVKWLNTIQTQK
nr:MAG TPA: hypothetical protein [Caudoviricetes sp.]